MTSSILSQIEVNHSLFDGPSRKKNTPNVGGRNEHPLRFGYRHCPNCNLRQWITQPAWCKQRPYENLQSFSGVSVKGFIEWDLGHDPCKGEHFLIGTLSILSHIILVHNSPPPHPVYPKGSRNEKNWHTNSSLASELKTASPALSKGTVVSMFTNEIHKATHKVKA